MKKGRALRTARKGKGGEHCSQKWEKDRNGKRASTAARQEKGDVQCG